VHELWNWEHSKNQIRSLRGRLGFREGGVLRFLGLSLSLEDGSVYDELRRKPFEDAVGIYFVLHGYANAKPAPETAKLISFKQLRGGQAYHKAFVERTIQPFARMFGSKPEASVEAAKLLGGTSQVYGDFSLRIYSLPLVPLTFVLWCKTEEFSASANILFDSNANSYLSTEELAGLGGLTFLRLKHAMEIVEMR
jgi:hypothetical protein